MTRSACEARVVDVHVTDGLGRDGYALVKRSFVRDGERWRETAPAPLRHAPEEAPLREGAESAPSLPATDVVVRACAYPTRAGQTQMEAEVVVGDARKRLCVIGARVARELRGRVVFSEPEALEPTTLDKASAYGGVDPRVRPPEFDALPPDLVAALIAAAPPGAYPRNPLGRGFAVGALGEQALALPRVEDPDQRLSPETLLAPSFDAWWQQPLPWHLDEQPVFAFPRSVRVSADAEPWREGPDDARLPEVRRGDLPASYRVRRDAAFEALGAQQGSLGMVFRRLAPGTPIAVRGCRPDGRAEVLTVPPPPDATLRFERASTRALALHRVELDVEAGEAHFVYGMHLPLPRPVVPGVQVQIPLWLEVAGEPPLPFAAPPPLRAGAP